MIEPLLFIASDRREAGPWVAQWENPHVLKLPVHWARTGQWRGRDVIAIANGIGVERAVAAVAATRSVASHFSGIVSIGTGGALDSSLEIGDVIVATAVTGWIAGTQAELPAPQYSALDPGGPTEHFGLVHSSRHIVRTAEEKRKLRQSGAIIVEMEAAGVARAALELAVPFYCVRAVSDLAGETFFIDFERFLMPDGQFNVAPLVMSALAHPVKGMGELLRLQRRTSQAAERLADFLGQCRF